MGQSKQQTARLFVLLFGMVFVLAGSLSAFIAAREIRHSLALTRQGERAEAVVVDYPYIRWGSGPRQSGNAVRLRFTAGEGSENEFITRPRVPRGSHAILYMASDPQDAKVDSFQSLWLWAAIGSGAAAMLLLIGVSILIRGLKRL